MSRTIPNCNRSFLIESLLENKRIDNRTFYQFRDLQVNFGQTFGSCYVQLGNTVVYASTEATLDEPRIARPSEGRFKVVINIGAGGKEKWLRNIERSQPTEAILTTRLLEKIINRINVLDLESLCLITGKSVWCISTKLVLLNYDGNLIEASSIAAIASLMHFKRPDATVTPDGDIIVHSFEERNPIPLTLFHYPICVTFQFMDHTHLKKIVSENQEILLEQHKNRVRKATQLMICDPTEEEEDFLNNVLIICANVYKEIVAIQSIGPLSLSSFSKQLLRTCSNKAFERVRFVTDYLKSCLEKHNNFSSNNFQRYNFYEAMKNGDLCVVQNYNRHPVLGNSKQDSSRNNQKEEFTNDDFNDLEDDYGQGGPSKWTVHMDDSNNQNDDEDMEEKPDDEQPKEIPTKKVLLESKTNKSFADVIGKPKGKNVNSIEKTKRPTVIVEKSNNKMITKPMEKKNQWTIVDKKKAATDADIKSTIQKLNEKRTKDKKININDDDDDEEEPVLLKWEFKKKK